MGWIYNGEELLKANKAQQDAVAAYQTQESIKAFIGNPNVPVVIGGGVLVYFAVQLTEGVLEWIRLLVPELRNMADEEWNKLKKNVKSMVNPLNYLSGAEDYAQIRDDMLAELTPEERVEVEEGVAQIEGFTQRSGLARFFRSVIPGI